MSQTQPPWSCEECGGQTYELCGCIAEVMICNSCPADQRSKFNCLCRPMQWKSFDKSADPEAKRQKFSHPQIPSGFERELMPTFKNRILYETYGVLSKTHREILQQHPNLLKLPYLDQLKLLSRYLKSPLPVPGPPTIPPYGRCFICNSEECTSHLFGLYLIEGAGLSAYNPPHSLSYNIITDTANYKAPVVCDPCAQQKCKIGSLLSFFGSVFLVDTVVSFENSHHYFISDTTQQEDDDKDSESSESGKLELKAFDAFWTDPLEKGRFSQPLTPTEIQRHHDIINDYCLFVRARYQMTHPTLAQFLDTETFDAFIETVIEKDKPTKIRLSFYYNTALCVTKFLLHPQYGGFWDASPVIRRLCQKRDSLSTQRDTEGPSEVESRGSQLSAFQLPKPVWSQPSQPNNFSSQIEEQNDSCDSFVVDDSYKEEDEDYQEQAASVSLSKEEKSQSVSEVIPEVDPEEERSTAKKLEKEIPLSDEPPESTVRPVPLLDQEVDTTLQRSIRPARLQKASTQSIKAVVPNSSPTLIQDSPTIDQVIRLDNVSLVENDLSGAFILRDRTDGKIICRSKEFTKEFTISTRLTRKEERKVLSTMNLDQEGKNVELMMIYYLDLSTNSHNIRSMLKTDELDGKIWTLVELLIATFQAKDYGELKELVGRFSYRRAVTEYRNLENIFACLIRDRVKQLAGKDDKFLDSHVKKICNSDLRLWRCGKAYADVGELFKALPEVVDILLDLPMTMLNSVSGLIMHRVRHIQLHGCSPTELLGQLIAKEHLLDPQKYLKAQLAKAKSSTT